MLFCDAYPTKKMLPLDRIATADPCLGQFQGCPIFRELLARPAQLGNPAPASPEHPGAAQKEASR